MKKTYLLFGTEACSELETLGATIDFFKWCKNHETDFSVFVFVKGETDALRLLSAYNGWGRYSEITEKMYNIIIAAK